MFCLSFAFSGVVYIGYSAYRTVDLYKNIKTKQRGWKGNVHAPDAELGFSPVPNSYGAHLFPVGPDIPMRYDEDGFRVTMEDGRALKRPRPLILALGCSFTYGDATYAKDTYPYLVGRSLKGTSKNAGVCSYGLSQMLLLAKKLIPVHRPDFLLVQYSPWLVGRAQTPFAPSYYGKIPTPFFYDKDNSFALNSPVFLTKVAGVPVERYRDTPSDMLDVLSFFWDVGLPLFFHDDTNMLMYIINRSIGVVPAPTRAQDKLIEYVYGQIDNIAKEYGAKLVIVVLGGNADLVEVSKQLFPSDVVWVNAQQALLRHLSSDNMTVNNENYKQAYAHWRGSPSIVVDGHPNELAHKIIADAIVSEIRRVSMQYKEAKVL